jgi:hypothetical protein
MPIAARRSEKQGRRHTGNDGKLAPNRAPHGECTKHHSHMHGETTAANPPGQGNLRGDVEARHSGDPGSACNEAGNYRGHWVASESKQRRC